MKLYRVLVKSTTSLQPCETYWKKEVLYCGYDKLEAVRIYHNSTPNDYSGSYGNPARRTMNQVKTVKAN